MSVHTKAYQSNLGMGDSNVRALSSSLVGTACLPGARLFVARADTHKEFSGRLLYCVVFADV